ncbi:FAD/NAD(P)-binding domain-containing protein [Kocuria sp. TGY1127_2]|uniref:FAD/NAD(P)-binding protein n=1 Tax=Kocuria sp. TGY1127_2 TaxID=2711328 RepID=UPI0015BB1F62|nr:FAD/NAD(P)-binding protein [Kocuria sp. TGY1127_2]
MGRTQRIVVIGAGPRGLSTVERLAAHAASRSDKNVEVHLVDPFPPGPGHVWRTDQSRLFLMNTPSFFPTVVPTDVTVTSAPSDGSYPRPISAVRGLSFEEWRARVTADSSFPLIGLSDGDLAEVHALTREGFPSRKLYGTYLSDIFARLRAGLPKTMSLNYHPQEAVRIAYGEQNTGRPYLVELGDGVVLSAHCVVLALGHTDAKLRDDQQDLMEFAASRRLHYWPPAIPADVRWAALPEGEDVLIRGMGLNFHDVLAQLTEGRGGTFEVDGDHPHRLTYQPSGREPKIWAGSRRGTPYRAKAVLDSYYPRSTQNKFFTRDYVDRTQQRAQSEGREIDFEVDYWPLIRRDAQWNYYRTLVRTEPDAIHGDPFEFLAQVEAILSDTEHSSWWSRLDRLVTDRVAPNLILAPERLSRPFEGQSFDSHEEYAAAVVHFLDRDVAASFLGEDSPIKMAIGSMNQARAIVKYAVQDHGISDESWIRGLERKFGGLVEGLASGPPVLRIQQMAALARAGVVRFLGPDPVFGADENAGCFIASSPWVRGEPVHADWLVEALAPANDVRVSTSPLLGRLFEDGFARPWQMHLADSPAPVPSKGLEVTESPHRLVRASGETEAGIFVLGLQLSSTQWGTAIAAEADAELRFGSSTVADSNEVARAVLG